MNRIAFLKVGLLGMSGITSYSAFGINPVQNPNQQIDIETIKEFVTAGHGDLDKVKLMLKEEPNLIYTSYDWGNGDYEQAIEGAGHLGKKEIANYLIENGARANLFVLTMLGKTNLVTPTLEEYPNLIKSKGAHGFSLLHHAKMGGKESEELYEYLTKKGLTKTKFDLRSS